MSIFGNDSKTEWFRAFTKSGLPAGLGAHCPVCGGGVRHSIYAGMTFEHCGTKEAPPSSWDKLPRKSLSTGALNHGGNWIMTEDLEECTDGASNTNTFPFENERRFDWV